MRCSLCPSWPNVVLTGVILTVALSACSHTARINTEPEGAEVFVNGVPIGQSPQLFKSRSGLPESYYLEITRPGYRTLKNVTIDRTYRADESLVLLLIGIIPYFFSARLEDQYIFHLLPEENAAPQPATFPQGDPAGAAEQGGMAPVPPPPPAVPPPSNAVAPPEN